MEWVKCNERSRPVGQPRLLLFADGVMVVGYWNRLRKEWFVNGEVQEGCKLYPTHWMPLPDPPTE